MAQNFATTLLQTMKYFKFLIRISIVPRLDIQGHSFSATWLIAWIFFCGITIDELQAQSKRNYADLKGKGQYAAAGDLKLYYEIHGSAQGKTPPLVLLHGGGSTIETSFGKILPLLAKTRQVIAFEQQGHGHTADTDRPFSFEQSADDAAALLKHLKIQKADFYGYSNGGNIALQIAIRHPALVRKLVVASGIFRKDGMPAEFWESMQHATLENMPAELKEAYIKASPHPKNLQSFHDKSVRRMLEFKDLPPEALQSIQAPTLVLIGDADIVKPEHAVEMFRLLPQGQLAILPGTDHMSLVNRTDLLSAIIPVFLDAATPKTK